MAACFVSNPFTNVPIWVAQIRLGQWLIDVLSLPVPHFLAKAQTSLPGVGTMSVSNFIVGFVAMGVILALCAFPLVHLFSAIMPHHLPVRRRRPWPLVKPERAASQLGSELNPGNEKPLNDVLPRGD
jgi:uncharacterized protein (DUF2062 family)